MKQRTPKHSRSVRILRVMFHRRRYTLTVSFLVIVAMILGVRYFDWEVEPVRVPAPRSWSQIEESDTLCVVAIPSSYTVFRYKDKWHGHEYEHAVQMAEALGLELKILLVNSVSAMADSLFSGAADVAISPMEYGLVNGHWFLRPTGPRWSDGQCLVSARRLNLAAYSDSLLLDSIQSGLLPDSVLDFLPKYKLSLLKDSYQWMKYRDDSIQQHYDFRPYLVDSLAADSLTLEQLTDSMVMGRTDALMMRCNVARLMHDYYPSLVISDTIPFTQDSLAWMVTAGADTLRHKIDSVSAELFDYETPHYVVAMKRYSDARRHRPRRAARYVKLEGALSPYDQVFQRKAEAYDLDWRLLAGIAYIESNFRADIMSSRGPIGLMQLMPQTVRSYGYTVEEALDPEVNVEMAAKLMSNLCKLVRNRVPGVSNDDMICFALAGYNAGLGHVYDAIRLAETLGYDPNVWPNNVEHCLRLKADPQYYKMSVVKSGQFNGAFTINYVNEVTDAYHTFCAQVPKE